MPRNGKGVFRTKGGRFCARYIDENGKRRSKTFQREADAVAWREAQRVRTRKADEALAKGDRPPAPVELESSSFGDFCKDWLEARRPEVKASTEKRYEQLVGMIRASPLAKLSVYELSFRDIESWFAELARQRSTKPSRKGQPRYGMESFRKLLNILRDICGRMQAEFALPRCPTDTVRIPREAKRRKRERTDVLSARELWAFLEALSDPYFDKVSPNWRPVLWLLGATGVRPCAVLGLRLCDLDFDAQVFRIRQTVYNGEVAGEEGDKMGVIGREVPLANPRLVEVVKAHIAAAESKPMALLFQNANGKPVHESSLPAPYRKALRLAGIPERPRQSPYSLRHTWNTIAVQTGQDQLVLRDTIGHSSEAMTERYFRASREQRIGLQMAMLEAAQAAAITH